MSDNELEEELPELTKKSTESKRIFINHIDSFNGKNLAKVSEILKVSCKINII